MRRASGWFRSCRAARGGDGRDTLAPGKPAGMKARKHTVSRGKPGPWHWPAPTCDCRKTHWSKPMPLRTMLALSCALLLHAPPGRTAESLEGCTGFIGTLPAVVDTQGVWCLRGDVSTAMTTGFAIYIQANNVTIDCNGFKVGGLAAGPSSDAYGIFANGRQNITVRNCTIRGFRDGIHLQGLGGSGHLIEDNQLDNNLVKGIMVE